MNDITKARYFFQTKGSKLKELTSFGLMLATAENKYRDVRRRQVGAPGDAEVIDPIEIDALVDYAVLKYLKKHNHLPVNAATALRQSTTLEEKRDMALAWLN
jgi:hypothetical protein